MEFESYADVIDSFERDDMGYGSLTDYINGENIKIKEIEMDVMGDLKKALSSKKDGGLMIAIENFNRGGMAGGKTYHQYHDQFVPPDSESMMYANGGGIGSMMIPTRQGLFMGGSPLTGESLAIYNSMNAYGYTDQEIADRLSGLGLYDPNTTTPPTTPPTTPSSGGGAGGGGEGDGFGSIFDIKNKKNRDSKIDLGIAAANADKGSLTLEEITAMNDLSGQESMRGQPTTTTSTLEELISAPPKKPPQSMLASEILAAQKLNQPKGLSARGTINRTPASQALDDEYYDKDEIIGITDRNRGQIPTETTSVLEEIVSNTTPGLEITDRNRGMEDNENFIDRGDLMNDLRVSDILEERDSAGGIFDRNRGQITSTPTGGITTIDKPNMRDIANDLERGPINMENIGAPEIEDIISGNFAEFGPQIIGDLSSIGIAKNPDVEDPFDGKYSPSFEEKKAATGIIEGLLENIKSYSPLQLDNVLTSLTSKGIFDLAGINNPYGLLSSATGLGFKSLKKKQVQKEIEKQAAATQNRKETREIQARIDAAEKKRKDDIAKRDATAAAQKAAREGRAYDYSGRSNKQGTHTSTISKEKAQDNREGGRGQQSSSGSKSSGSKSSGSYSSSRGSNFGGRFHGAKGGRVAKAIR